MTFNALIEMRLFDGSMHYRGRLMIMAHRMDGFSLVLRVVILQLLVEPALKLEMKHFFNGTISVQRL